MSKFIKPTLTDEQLQKWIDERRKRFPTKAKREQQLNNECQKDEKKINESKPKKNIDDTDDNPLEIKGKMEDEVGKEIKEIKDLKDKQEELKKLKEKKKKQDITKVLMDQMQQQIQGIEYEIILEAIDFLLTKY